MMNNSNRDLLLRNVSVRWRWRIKWEGLKGTFIWWFSPHALVANLKYHLWVDWPFKLTKWNLSMALTACTVLSIHIPMIPVTRLCFLLYGTVSQPTRCLLKQCFLFALVYCSLVRLWSPEYIAQKECILLTVMTYPPTWSTIVLS